MCSICSRDRARASSSRVELRDRPARRGRGTAGRGVRPLRTSALPTPMPGDTPSPVRRMATSSKPRSTSALSAVDAPLLVGAVRRERDRAALRRAEQQQPHDALAVHLAAAAATRICDAKALAAWTNRAAARACRPSALVTVTSHDVIPSRRAADPTSPRWRCARARASRARASRRSMSCGGRASLISIGRLTPVITSTCGADERHAEVGRRAAEQVGQHQHVRRLALGPAGRRPDPLDRLADVLFRVIHVVVPADRHGGHVRQRRRRSSPPSSSAPPRADRE